MTQYLPSQVAASLFDVQKTFLKGTTSSLPPNLGPFNITGLSTFPISSEPTGPFLSAMTATSGWFNRLYPFATTDKEDAKYNLALKYTEPDGVAQYYTDSTSHVGKVFLGDDYFEYLQRKVDQTMWLQFKRYLFQIVDLSTPASRAYWTKKNPELLKEIDLGMRKRQEYLMRIFDIQRLGIQNDADMLFLWNCFHQEFDFPIDMESAPVLKFKENWTSLYANSYAIGPSGGPVLPEYRASAPRQSIDLINFEK